MDDFSVYGDSFDNCLENLTLVLNCCIKTNLVLNWEKCHFMVNQGRVLGHIISSQGIEVDKIEDRPCLFITYPNKCVRDSLFSWSYKVPSKVHQGFSKIALPLCRLLQKDVLFAHTLVIGNDDDEM